VLSYSAVTTLRVTAGAFCHQ